MTSTEILHFREKVKMEEQPMTIKVKEVISEEEPANEPKAKNK